MGEWKENKDDWEEMFIEGPLPHWTIARSEGYYMIVGTQLQIRDGRRMGNAFVDRIYYHNNLRRCVAVCYTDAGNTVNLVLDEMEECFHTPEWIMVN